MICGAGFEAAERRGRGDPVHLWHADVHQDDVGAVLAHGCHRADPVVGLADDLDVVSRGQDEPQPRPDQGVVVDQQHFHPHHVSAACTTKSPEPSGPTVRVPPANATRSCSPSSPAPEPGSVGAVDAGTG